MEFDNQRFERNIHKSMKSLDEMNDKLKFEDAGKGLKNLTDSLNKTDFSNLENSLSHIEKRFSTIGIIGGSLIHRLTNDAVDAVNSVMHLFTTPMKKMSGMIYSGGLSRSMNIEKAKFQLEGLGVTWTSIFGDIDYAVTNTAYALDSAAVAASQLVASGVQIGNDLTPQLRELGYTGEIGAEGLDSMAVSLKAISGVAAQTSSDYDSIAHIFTTVAGQGRLMTMQLRQLEMRGLNVAAKIGEVIGATEAQVREMVSRGMIDYETFANSMFTLFADHAAEANKTLSGVTANIKAAFSRIGADFINPIIKNEGPLVEMLEQIRKRINYIKKALTDWKRGALLDDKAVADATSILEGITAAIKRLPIQNVVVIMNAVGKIYSGLSTMVKNLKPFFKAIKEDFAELFPKKHTIHDVWVFGEKVKAILSNIKYIHEYTNNIVEVGSDGIMRVVEVTSEKVDPKLDKLRRTLKGIGAAFSILKQAVEVVLAPIKTFIKIFFKGDSLFLTATASLGDFLVGIDKFIKDSGIFVKAGEKLSWVVEKVVGGFVRLKDGFLNGMSIMDRRSGRMMDIGSIFASMAPDMGLVEKLGMGISAAFGFIGNAFTFVKDKIGGVIDRFRGLNKEGSTTAELIEGLKSKKRLLEKIPYIVKLALNFVKDKIAAIKEAAPELLEKAKEGFGNLKEAIDPVVTSIGEFISTLGSDAIKKFIEWFSAGTTIIQNNSDKIGSGFDKVRNVLHDILEFIRTEAANGFETLTSALGNFVNSGYAGKILDFAERLIKMRIGWKFGTFIGQTGMLNEKIAGVMGKVSEAINKFLHPIQSKRGKKNPFQKIADIMLEVAASIGIITASMLIIANTPQDKLDKALYVLIDLFSMYAILGMVMRKSGKGLNIGGKGLISMAFSIVIIATAIKKLANGVDDPDMMRAATLSIMGVMGVLLYFINKTSKMNITGKIGDFVATTKAMGKFMGTMARSLITLSIGVTALLVPIKLFGSMDPDQLKQGLKVVAPILIGVAGLALLIGWMSNSLAGEGSRTNVDVLNKLSVLGVSGSHMEGITEDTGKFKLSKSPDVIKELGKTFTRIAGAMIILSIGVSAMAVPILIFGRLVKDDIFDKGLKAVGKISAIAGIAFLLVGLVYKFTEGRETNKYDVKLIRQLSGSIGEIAAGMIVLAGAMVAMYYPVKLFGEMPQPKFEQGTKVLYTVLGGVAAFIITMAILTKTGSFSKLRQNGAFLHDSDFEITGTLNGVTKVVLGVSAAMIGIAFAMKIMAGAMADVSEIPSDTFKQGYKTLCTVLAIVGGLIVVLAIIGAVGNKGGDGDKHSIILDGLSSKLVAGLKAIPKGLKKIGNVVRTAAILVAAASVIMSIAGAVALIAKSIIDLSKIDETKFNKAANTIIAVLGGFMVFTTILTVIAKRMNGVDLINVAGVLLSVSVAIIAISGAVVMLCQGLNNLNNIPDLEKLGTVILNVALTFGVLVGLASVIPAFEYGLLAVCGAIALLGASVFLGAKGIEVFVKAINDFNVETKKKLPEVVDVIGDNIGRFCGVILKSGGIIAATIVGVIAEALGIVAGTSFEFGATAGAIIGGLLSGLASTAGVMVGGLIAFLIAVFDSLSKYLDEEGTLLVESIVGAAESLCAALIKGLFGKDERVKNIGRRTGDALKEGMKESLGEDNWLYKLYNFYDEHTNSPGLATIGTLGFLGYNGIKLGSSALKGGAKALWGWLTGSAAVGSASTAAGTAVSAAGSATAKTALLGSVEAAGTTTGIKAFLGGLLTKIGGLLPTVLPYAGLVAGGAVASYAITDKEVKAMDKEYEEQSRYRDKILPLFAELVNNLDPFINSKEGTKTSNSIEDKYGDEYKEKYKYYKNSSKWLSTKWSFVDWFAHYISPGGNRPNLRLDNMTNEEFGYLLKRKKWIDIVNELKKYGFTNLTIDKMNADYVGLNGNNPYGKNGDYDKLYYLYTKHKDEIDKKNKRYYWPVDPKDPPRVADETDSNNTEVLNSTNESTKKTSSLVQTIDENVKKLLNGDLFKNFNFSDILNSVIDSDTVNKVKDVMQDKTGIDISGKLDTLINKIDKLSPSVNNYSIEGITVDEGSSTAEAIDLITNEAIRYRRA